MPKKSEDYTDPTGLKAVKIKGQTMYQYQYGKGKGRFVNTNPCCEACDLRTDCYKGKHAKVGCCGERMVNGEPTEYQRAFKANRSGDRKDKRMSKKDKRSPSTTRKRRVRKT